MSSAHSARNRVREAILSGKMTRPDVCSKCGSNGQVIGHHNDYSKPLEITWLCLKCHRNIHPRTRRNDGTNCSQVITKRVVGRYICRRCNGEFPLYQNQRRRYCPNCFVIVSTENGKLGGRSTNANSKGKE
jgi:ribosomal protein S27AE